MNDPTLRLAEALGAVAAARAQLRSARDALDTANCFALAAQVVPTLLVLDEVQHAVQAQLAGALRAQEEER